MTQNALDPTALCFSGHYPRHPLCRTHFTPTVAFSILPVKDDHSFDSIVCIRLERPLGEREGAVTILSDLQLARLVPIFYSKE